MCRTRGREVVIASEDGGPGLRAVFSTSDEAIQQDMIAWLQNVAQTMDILEPLERIKAALKTLLGEQQKR